MHLSCRLNIFGSRLGLASLPMAVDHAEDMSQEDSCHQAIYGLLYLGNVSKVLTSPEAIWVVSWVNQGPWSVP